MRGLQSTLCLQTTAGRRGVQYFQWCQESSRSMCCSGKLVTSASQQTVWVRRSTPESKRGLPCSFRRFTRDGRYWRRLHSTGRHYNWVDSELNHSSFQRKQGRLGRVRWSSRRDGVPRDRPILASSVALSRVDNGSASVKRRRHFRG